MEFAFQPELESLDAVPSEFKPLYQEAEGKFRLGENFSGVAKAVNGLNQALRAERKNKATDLGPLKDYGATPEEIHGKFKSTLQELETRLTEGGKVNIDKIRKEFAEQHGVEVKKLSTRNEALQGQLYKVLVENSASAAIVEAKGDPSLVLPFVKDRVKVIEENGQLSVYVVDAAGDREYSAVTGQPKTVKELVLELKGQPKFQRLFDSDANSGGGMNPSGGNRPPPRKEATNENSNPIDRIKAGLKAGRLTPKNKEKHFGSQ